MMLSGCHCCDGYSGGQQSTEQSGNQLLGEFTQAAAPLHVVVRDHTLGRSLHFSIHASSSSSSSSSGAIIPAVDVVIWC